MLTETVSASSATGHARQVAFQDQIPEAVARTTQTVVFTPAPAKIVKADPVVEWLLRLPSHGTVQVGYHATVPALGATKSRLMGLVKDFDALQAAAPATVRPQAVQLASLAIEPGAVQLKPRGSIRWHSLAGWQRPGRPAAVLGDAAWSAANPAVASVTSPGIVTGVSAGSTQVTARIGGAQVSAPVTVAAASSPSQPATRRASPAKSKSTVAVKTPAKTAQKISFTSAPPVSPVAGTSYDVTASGGGSGNPVTFTIDPSSTSVCSISSSAVTFSQPGSCVIDANQAGNATYRPPPRPSRQSR